LIFTQPPYPWSFIVDKSSFKKHKDENVKTLILEPPKKKGSVWEEETHSLEYERVREAWDFLIGADGETKFKLDKIELVLNESLEKVFFAKHTTSFE